MLFCVINKKMQTHYSIELRNKYTGMNIGGVLLENLEAIKQCGATSATFAVRNTSIWGNFVIPDALGFSTPIGPLTSGGTIVLDRCSGVGLSKRLLDWKSIYSCYTVKCDK